MERYLKPYELAYELGVSQQTIARWLNSGKLEFVQLSPRRRVIPESAIKQFLAAKIVAPPKKMVDQGQASAKDSGKRSLAIRSTGGNEREISISQLTKEISQLCR
jgi:excisionase family DNA binding protein